MRGTLTCFCIVQGFNGCVLACSLQVATRTDGFLLRLVTNVILENLRRLVRMGLRRKPVKMVSRA